jgi:glucans biosynthesis protein C
MARIPLSQRDRVHALDAVRAFALLSGVFLHASWSFWPRVDQMGWPVPDPSPSIALALASYVIHVFRMTTFFLIAGFFGHLLFHRLGLWRFVRDRAQRIGIPLIVGWVVVSPAALGVLVWGFQRARGGHAPLHRATLYLPMAHLWFLYVVSLMYAALLIMRTAFVSLGDRGGEIRARIDRAVRFLIGGPLVPLVLAVPLGISLILEDGWVMWLGIPTPLSLVPNRPSVVGFGIAFGLGWVLHRQQQLLEVLGRRWLEHAIAATVSIVAALSIVGFEPDFTASSPGWRQVTYAASYSIAVWASTFAVIGAGVRFFSSFDPVRRYIADSSYWIYLAHFPLVYYAQRLLGEWRVHWGLKFGLIFVVSLVLLFASYHFLVRSTWIGAILYGRRSQRPRLAHESSTTWAA